MKFLNGNNYLEVKDKKYLIHPTENITFENEILQNLSELNIKSKMKLRLVKIKVIKNDNNQLVFNNYPKNKQPIIQQPKFKPNCPGCKRNIWLEFEKGYYCQNCEHIIKKQNHQIDNKDRRHHFYTRLPYAN